MNRQKKKISTASKAPKSSVKDWNSDDSAYVPPAFGSTEEIAASSTFSRSAGKFISTPSVYPNIDNSVSPFSTSGSDFVSTQEAVRRAVKAYWAFPLLRNVVEVMGELSNSRLYLKGGNKKTRDFIEAWWGQINIWSIKEQFFREWFRSANCFLYRLDGEFTPTDLTKMQQAFGSQALSNTKTIPIRYVLLNPEMISAGASLAFDRSIYYKTLSSFEIERIKNPKTPEDKLMVKSLDPISVKNIKAGTSTFLKLNPEQLSVLLYKRQDYEPMGVPMAYGVINDIETKLAMKRMDLSIAKTTDRAMLLITVGETPNAFSKGNNINYNTIAAIQGMFANEGVSRTLIADYTVKGEWLIPDLTKVLGPEKYAQVDKDINVGLNAVLFDTGEKFANTSIKVQIFVERLKEARNAFLHNFLQPEIKRVCDALNSKSVPEAVFEDLSLKDELQYSKLVAQLYQFGLLTPSEAFDALDSGKMPLNEESLESQKEFKTLKDQGLYLPIIGGSTQIQQDQLDIQQQQVKIQEKSAETAAVTAKAAAKAKAATIQQAPNAKGPAGRPAGSSAPKSTTSTSPIGSATAHSLSKLKEIFPKISDLHNAVEDGLKKKHKIKKLNEAQASIGSLIVESIITNEPQDAWTSKIDEYIASPKEISLAANREIEDLQVRYDVTSYMAAILRHITTEAPDGNNS